MAEEQTDDLIKFQELVKSQVETYFQEQVAKTPALQQAQQVAVSQQEDAAQRQLRELISPFVEPGIAQARMDSADGLDYAKFYTNNPDAIEYQESVEKMFDALKKAGRPLPRADILAHTIGKEFTADRDKFTEKLTAKRKAQLERAEQGGDVGGMVASRAKQDSTFGQGRFEQLSTADMEKALDGVTF